MLGCCFSSCAFNKVAILEPIVFFLKLLCDYSLNNVTIKKTKGQGMNNIKMADFQTPLVTGTE